MYLVSFLSLLSVPCSLRTRLANLGSGSLQLLESMLHFDPSKR